MNIIKSKKFFSVFTLFIVIIAVIVGGTYFVLSYKSLNNIVNKMLTIISKQGVLSVDTNIKNEISKAQFISNSKIVRQASNSEEEMLEIIEKISGYSDEKIYVLINEYGHAVSNMGHIFNVSSHDFFRESMNGKANISEPILMGSGECVCFVAVPYYDLDNKISGSLAITFPAQDLKTIINNISIFENGSTFIINGNGEIIAGIGDDIIDDVTGATIQFDGKNSTKEYKSFNDFISLALYKKSGQAEYVIDYSEKIALYEPIPSTNWTLVSSLPKNNVYYEIYKVLMTIFLGMTTIVAFVLLLYIYSMKLRKNLTKESQRFFAAVNVANLLTMEILEDGTIINVNDNFFNIMGYPKDEIIRENIKKFILTEQFEIYMAQLLNFVNNKISGDMEACLLKNDGSIIHLIWNCFYNEKGDSQKTLYLIGTNITKIKDFQAKIHKLAYFDTLTDLMNRASFEEYLCEKIENNYKFSILYLDFDNFKYINDSFGHSKGDTYLLDICKRIHEIKKENHPMFRVGGDEIVIIIDDIEYSIIYEYADTILKTVNEDYYINGIKINSSCSIGISRYPQDGVDYSEIFKSAEIAMNKAKSLGKSRVIFHDRNMDIDLIKSILIENDLRNAVKNQDFTLFYQPQYNIESGELYGFEALIRWTNHPVRGFVSPEEFIPIAEKTRLIIEIGVWVLKIASEFSNRINKKSEYCLPISVNISFVQFSDDNFVNSVINILDANNVKYNTIKFELTESVVMESIEKNLLKIDELHSRGLKFALDDFGTGYSSLTYLKRLPIQLLKIDKSFVDTILDNLDESKAILSSIIYLSHNLNIQVVAEGVEEKAQLDWLRRRGCNICQGYYSGRPMPPEEAIKLIGSNMYKK